MEGDWRRSNDRPVYWGAPWARIGGGAGDDGSLSHHHPQPPQRSCRIGRTDNLSPPPVTWEPSADAPFRPPPQRSLRTWAWPCPVADERAKPLPDIAGVAGAGYFCASSSLRWWNVWNDVSAFSWPKQAPLDQQSLLLCSIRLQTTWSSSEI